MGLFWIRKDELDMLKEFEKSRLKYYKELNKEITNDIINTCLNVLYKYNNESRKEK